MNDKDKICKTCNQIYKSLVESGLSDRYCLLCFNCNQAKAFYNICPHKIGELK